MISCNLCQLLGRLWLIFQRVALTRDPSWTHLISSLSYMKNSPAWPYLTSYFPDKLGMCPSDHEVFKERKTPGETCSRAQVVCRNVTVVNLIFKSYLVLFLGVKTLVLTRVMCMQHIYPSFIESFQPCRTSLQF